MNFKLKSDIRIAIAWGNPSSESIGYTHSEYNKLLVQCLKRIEYLEQTLEDNNIRFTQTDFRNTASH